MAWWFWSGEADLRFLAAYSKNNIAFKARMQEERGDGEIYVFYSDEASVGIKTMRK